MGKRLIPVLAALLTMLCLTALAEDDWRVAEGLPVLDIIWRDTGESTGDDRRPYLLAADVRAADGSFSQVVRWFSAEADDRIAPHVRLVDYNFDGYKDLQLLTAQGARNVYYTVALWDEERGCFRDVVQHVLYQPGGVFEDKLVQAEFCNPEFYPEPGNRSNAGYILCVEADGFYYRTERVYGWVGHDALENYEVVSIYDAGDGLIGESLDQWVQGLNRLWDQTYPEDWYYGTDASDDRRAGRRLLMLGQGENFLRNMQVCNVSWVNLRQLDSKDSPSLAKLDRGTTVQVLATGCGEDDGWVLVYCGNEALGIPSNADPCNDREMCGITGYIWHSYLEPCVMYIANVDWVNVREEADKESSVVTKLDRGARVTRSSGDAKDGWVPVSGWLEKDGFFSGYIWHSYLEPEEFVPYQ